MFLEKKDNKKQSKTKQKPPMLPVIVCLAHEITDSTARKLG